MLFRVENRRGQRVSHCGVLEFIAQEGMCYMPQWVRSSLGTEREVISEAML